MKIIEICSLLVMLLLGVYASITDISRGIIKNRILAIASVYAVIADTAYYGFLARDLALSFLLNIVSVTVFSLILFFTHSWAGGDCKLLCVLSFLYPADFYLSCNEQTTTLIFCIVFAFLTGYGFLVIDYITSLLRKQIHISVKQVKQSFFSFIKSYIRVLIYLSALHLVYNLIISARIEVNEFILTAIDFCMAWIISSAKPLQNRIFWIPVLILDIIISIIFRIIPIGTSWIQYTFIFGVILLRIILTEQNYKTIPTSQVKRGMILSTMTTIQFINSRVKGLPEISKEDLRSRLTADEAESVKRWEHSSCGQSEITIVRKIPFAIFIFLGFLIYFIIWSVI